MSKVSWTLFRFDQKLKLQTMNTDKDIRASLAEAISEKRAELQWLEGAFAILNGPMKARKRKPSNDAISENKVSTGGRLKGFREKILAHIARNSDAKTKDVALALYDRGLGVTKAKMVKRIASTMQHMQSDGIIRSKRNGQGREVVWSVTKKGEAVQAQA